MARRVLQLLGPSTGGIRRHVATLTAGLEARGWPVEVAGPAGVMDDVGRQDHVVTVGFDPRSLVGGWRALRALVAGVDLVHAHGMKAGWLAAATPRRPPVVCTVHNVVLDGARGSSVLRRLERALPRRVERTIAVSADITNRLGVAATVIPPAGPAPVASRAAAEVRAELGVDGAPLVVTVARLHPQKDLPTLLGAASVVRQRVPEARFVVAGVGPLRDSLLAEVAARGLDDTVSFVGYRDRLADDLAAADVFALSSVWEGSPMSVAEAMLLGRPVAATAVGALPEVVFDGETGRLVPPGEPGQLGAAIADLLLDRAEAERLGAAGQKLAQERFATDALIDAVVAVYEEVLGS